jgi:hypothetical protein
MPEFSHDEIRKYAHQLWEKAGCPEGQSEEFWHQAKSEMEADVPGDEDPKPLPE